MPPREPLPPLPSTAPWTPAEEAPKAPKYLTVPEISRRTGRMKESKSSSKKHTRRSRSSTIIPFHKPIDKTEETKPTAGGEGGCAQPASSVIPEGDGQGKNSLLPSGGVQSQASRTNRAPPEENDKPHATQVGKLRTLKVVDMNTPEPGPEVLSVSILCPKNTSKSKVEAREFSRSSQENVSVFPSGQADSPLVNKSHYKAPSRQYHNGQVLESSGKTGKQTSRMKGPNALTPTS